MAPHVDIHHLPILSLKPFLENRSSLIYENLGPESWSGYQREVENFERLKVSE